VENSVAGWSFFLKLRLQIPIEHGQMRVSKIRQGELTEIGRNESQHISKKKIRKNECGKCPEEEI
jgi:hypothetical protein